MPSTIKPKRIFWLGMHKVLTQTELPRLRQLGFEVYNPPYLSDVEDQSAVRDWTAAPTTLPEDVHLKLSTTNFFYQPISGEIAEILNEYFDAAIVTINPTWLKHFMAAYRGPVIYRVYGQPNSLAQELANNGAIASISDRENFWFCPHSEYTLDIEDEWLLERMRIVPYCLTPDVFPLKDQWTFNAENSTVGLLCPRAADIPYYKDNYKYLNRFLPGDEYRIFGAQVATLEDPRIVGTLERDEFLRRFARLRGFVYHYSEPTVCYLPPIEFMTIGGPVVFQSCSLLARYFSGRPAPGMAQDVEELALHAQRLHKGDQGFIREVIESQSEVRKLYNPDYVWPRFDDAFREMLNDKTLAPAPRFLSSVNSRSSPAPMAQPPRETLLLFHHFGPITHKRGSSYHCSEGVARVARLVVNALLEAGEQVMVTAFVGDIGRVRGFFGSPTNARGRLKILCVNDSWATYGQVSAKPLLINRIIARVRRLPKSIKYRLGFRPPFPSLVNYVNSHDSITHVIVPHYYLFPEVLKFVGKRLFLYLPDYLPHFYRGSEEMGDREDWEQIGASLCANAEAIFTNSQFTKRYLPETRLRVDARKIRHLPLPFLNNLEIASDAPYDKAFAESLPELFVFYPTRDRPSKRLRDFVETVAIVNRRLETSGNSARLFGVLTTEISENLCPQSSPVREYLKTYCEISDADLAYLYLRAVCLLFTSELEGNFPTQVREALQFETPIVATRMPILLEDLGEQSDGLLLADIGDCEALAVAVLKAMNSRSQVLHRQMSVATWVQQEFSYEKFARGLIEMMGFKQRANE